MPLPWLDQPIMIEGSRMSMCDQTADECAYKAERFRNWYIADYVYAQGATYFFVAAIGACMLAYAASSTAPSSLAKTRLWCKSEALLRYLAYRRWTIAGYPTVSVGVALLIACGAVFFAAMTLGPQPYYWPDISWGGSPPIATRAGWMALACLPFMLALSTKANMIAAVTGVSHEKLIVFHNWTGWAMFVLALIHTFPFLVVDFQNGIMEQQWTGSIFYWSGVVALIAQAYLQFFSLSFIRNRFYEFFKATHLLMALVFVLFLFFHCDFTLTSCYYFIAAAVLYFSSLAFAQVRTCFEHGLSLRATLDLVAPGMVRVTVPARRNTTWRPGQHMFLRFPGGGAVGGAAHGLTSHPFTICSVPFSATGESLGNNGGDDNDGEKKNEPRNELVFYAAVRGGITGKLGRIAGAVVSGTPHRDSPSSSPSSSTSSTRTTVPVHLDGPYGGIKGRPLDSFDDNLIIACGAGAAFSLGFVMDAMLLRAATRRHATTATEGGAGITPRLEVVIATRDRALLGWYSDALATFIHANGLPADCVKGVRISVYVTAGTGPTAASSSSSSSSPSTKEVDVETKGDAAAAVVVGSLPTAAPSVGGLLQIETIAGRPDISALIHGASSSSSTGQRQQQSRTSSLAIVACGPGSVLEEVQAAAAQAQLRILAGREGARTQVYLHTEHFSW
ncbi:ferric reductase like transmembrane component-domain-containing protein [Microdochium trichocladiopsis]|uniref:Ferric reductase like transmembrane component-domain-containing protein n=1 Tax=Microdochium trichocladiopsis TaxID=1682393 RepID=A0A9P8XXH3_9PEZI|nr:ferric reductase like transmembrane component-domain-containing protein [Microdochium trichocladiopsis]KAH7024617.1 ferric reductase like transmembrane component-domain-containing protein [Microdochium trichocladiopsis]